MSHWLVGLLISNLNWPSVLLRQPRLWWVFAGTRSLEIASPAQHDWGGLVSLFKQAFGARWVGNGLDTQHIPFILSYENWTLPRWGLIRSASTEWVLRTHAPPTENTDSLNSYIPWATSDDWMHKEFIQILLDVHNRRFDQSHNKGLQCFWHHFMFPQQFFSTPIPPGWFILEYSDLSLVFGLF